VPPILPGAVLAVVSYRDWDRDQRALRLGRPLPRTVVPRILVSVVAAVALLAAVLVVVTRGPDPWARQRPPTATAPRPPTTQPPHDTTQPATPNLAPRRPGGGAVDRAPADLGGLDEFEGHRHAGGAGAGALVTRWRSRTVAKVDSIGLVVRR
jgi:hypothetical protein